MTDHFDRGIAQATRRSQPAKAGTDDDHYRFAIDAHRVIQVKGKVRLYAGFCATPSPLDAVTIIPLGRARSPAQATYPRPLRARSSAAYSVLLHVEIARFTRPTLKNPACRLVSVALILTSRWTGVTCYVALWSPDVPLATRVPAIVQRTLQRNFTQLEYNMAPVNPPECAPHDAHRCLR